MTARALADDSRKQFGELSAVFGKVAFARTSTTAVPGRG